MNSNISDLKITIRDLVKGYKNSDEDGVYGYDGKLTIRPASKGSLYTRISKEMLL